LAGACFWLNGSLPPPPRCYVAGQMPLLFGARLDTNLTAMSHITGLGVDELRALAPHFDTSVLRNCSVDRMRAIGANLVSRGGGRPFASFFALPFSANTVDASLAHTFLTAVATGFYQGDVLSSPATSGTWRIATDGGDTAVWMHVRQTNDTAACLQRTYKATPCGGPGERREVLLMPTTLHTYSCFGGVDTDYLSLLASFTSVAKEAVKRPTFLGIPNQAGARRGCRAGLPRQQREAAARDSGAVRDGGAVGAAHP
jgi:hypothetical protein